MNAAKWIPTVENVGVSFAVRIGRGCRFVFINHETSYVSNFGGSEWDDILEDVVHNMGIFRRNLAEALRS